MTYYALSPVLRALFTYELIESRQQHREEGMNEGPCVQLTRGKTGVWARQFVPNCTLTPLAATEKNGSLLSCP